MHNWSPSATSGEPIEFSMNCDRLVDVVLSGVKSRTMEFPHSLSDSKYMAEKKILEGSLLAVPWQLFIKGPC